MKIATSTGGIGYAGRGIGKSRVDARHLDDGDDQSGLDGGGDEALPSLAAFGDRTPPRGSFVNILV